MFPNPGNAQRVQRLAAKRPVAVNAELDDSEVREVS